jgi:hypothetical protein
MSEMTYELACDLLLSHDWQFAKTMASNPHWYTRRTGWPDRLFQDVVVYIRTHGYDDLWPLPRRPWSRLYTYLDVVDEDGVAWCHWSMGWDPAVTILINRAKLPNGIAPAEPLLREPLPDQTG